MNPKIDFQLHEAFPDHRVTGRNCRANAPVGTVFTALQRLNAAAIRLAPVFIGETLAHVVTSRPMARAFHVRCESGSIIEEPLQTRYLQSTNGAANE